MCFNMHKMDQHTEGKCKDFLFNTQKKCVVFTGQKPRFSPV